MSESQSLGKLEKINLRSVWNDEARDFTPWLAEDNLDLLEKTIGLDLELEGTEKSVGRLNADILCKDTVDDNWVLIENQLGRTDHKHLGQLLTYASGLGAVTWISDRFSDEHRSALDWLNEITKEGVNFFGLEIELWKIGDSPPAPKLNVESEPNDWSEQVSSTAERGEELSELKQLQLHYWTTLKERIEDLCRRVKPRTPKPSHTASFAVGRSGCKLKVRLDAEGGTVGVELQLSDREEGEPLFHLLKNERKEIESDLGHKLRWNLKPDRKKCVVDRTLELDPTDRESWLEQHKQVAETLEAFHETFSPRLKRLDPDDWETVQED